MRVLCGFVFALLISSQAVWGQSGNYFLSHHTPSDENIDYLSFDIVQNGKGVIYFANKSGIVEFDGRNWNVIEAPGAIYSLAIAEGDELYVGGLTGFGKLYDTRFICEINYSLTVLHNVKTQVVNVLVRRCVVRKKVVT